MRVTANIEDFKVAKDKELPADSEPLIYLYGIDGADTKDESKALAKRAVNKDSGNSRFFIRTNERGAPFNHFEYNQEEIKSFNVLKGSYKFKFKSVNEEAFNHYLRFLTTRNPNHLKHCERA